MSVSTVHVSVLLSVVCLGIVFVGGWYLQSSLMEVNTLVMEQQCWGRYFEKVTSYILLVTFRKSSSLHITDYFQEKVTRYSYILL